MHNEQAVNATRLCGFDDWRLPTRTELLSIVNYGNRDPATDPQFFPDSPPPRQFASTWTASTSARGIGQVVWAVDFLGGYATQERKYDYGRVRLVRGEPSPAIP